MPAVKHVARHRNLACAALLVVYVSLPVAARADLTGKWSFGPTMPLVEITQVGSAVSFNLGPWTFTGTLSGGLLDVFAGPCQSQIRAGISANETRFMGPQISASAPPSCFPLDENLVDARRCQCDDGNTVDGDGCDARCQIETCFTCSGDPSVCTPAGDGAACDDHKDCTTGETCAGGMCGGGMPVTACVDVTGTWLFHTDTYDFFGAHSVSDGLVQLTQSGTFLQTGGYAGGIDPATGDFFLQALAAEEYFICPQGLLRGHAALDGRTLTASGITAYIFTHAPPTECAAAVSTYVSGSRCGNGTLEPGEECDDGNNASGDGCDLTCHVEECFTCIGTPSSCTPRPDGTSCDAHDACALEPSCRAGACTTGQRLDCGPCLECAAGGCVAAPRTDCRTSTSPSMTKLVLKNPTSSERDVITWK